MRSVYEFLLLVLDWHAGVSADTDFCSLEALEHEGQCWKHLIGDR